MSRAYPDKRQRRRLRRKYGRAFARKVEASPFGRVKVWLRRVEERHRREVRARLRTEAERLAYEHVIIPTVEEARRLTAKYILTGNVYVERSGTILMRPDPFGWREERGGRT